MALQKQYLYTNSAEVTDVICAVGQSTADAGAIGYVIAPPYASLLVGVRAAVTTASATATGELTISETTNSATLATLDHATSASAGDLLTGTLDSTISVVPANAVVKIDTTGSSSSASGVVNLTLAFARCELAG